MERREGGRSQPKAPSPPAERAAGCKACLGDPSGNLGHVLKHLESKVVGAHAAWTPTQPGLSRVAQGLPHGSAGRQWMSRAAGRDRAEASGLRLHCGSHMTCHHMTAQGTPPPTGPLPPPNLLPPWLPAGFCCICLESNTLGAASFSTLFQRVQGCTKSRRNNKQPYFPKLALLEAWTLPDHRPGSMAIGGLGFQ